MSIIKKLFGKYNLVRNDCRSMSSPEYASINNAIWHLVYPETYLKRTLPKWFGKPPMFNGMVDFKCPNLGVLEMNSGQILGQAGWIISAEGILLPDHSWYNSNPKEMPKLNGNYKIRKVKGRCLTLASDFAHNNWCHFLIDVIPKFHLFQKSGYDIKQIEAVYCPKPISPSGWQVIESLDIPIEKYIWSSHKLIIEPDVIIAPTFPGSRRNCAPFVPQFLKDLLIQDSHSRTRRLYIPRGKHGRNIINENELIDILLSFDFEILDPIESQNAFRDFAEAKIIIGAHGAGLANIVFCKKGTSLLELLPPKHIYPYYYTISDSVGINYSCLVGQHWESSQVGGRALHSNNFFVDLEQFSKAVKHIINESELIE